MGAHKIVYIIYILCIKPIMSKWGGGAPQVMEQDYLLRLFSKQNLLN